MVRSIHADLQTAQEIMGTPYIYLLFTSADGGTTHNYSTGGGVAADRVLWIEHHEEAYNDYAIIMLRNEDRAIPDLRGYWIEIGYGYDTTSGNKYEQTSRLWVKSQQTMSSEGKLIEVLTLEGMWAKLREAIYRVGDPPYYHSDHTTDTVYAIIAAVLAESSMTLDAIGSQSDGIIDSFTPNFQVNNVPFENPAAIIYRLIRMTKTYLRPQKTLAWKVVYPQTTDTVEVTYYSNQAHWFWEYVEKTNCLIPNHILVFANADENGNFDATTMITAEASDATEIARIYEAYKVHIAGNITNQTDADNRAAAILSRVKGEQMAGRALVPHDIRVELHDRVSVVDYRSG